MPLYRHSPSAVRRLPTGHGPALVLGPGWGPLLLGTDLCCLHPPSLWAFISAGSGNSHTLRCVQSQDPSINHPPPEPVPGLDCVTRHLRVGCGAQHVCGKAPDARRTPWCYCPPPSSRARGLLAASRARDPAGADSLPLYGRCLIPRNTGTRVPEEPQPHSN